MLNTAGGVGLKPGVSVNFFALDRDQAAAGVGRNDADRDVIARIEFLTVELDLQLGIFFQRTRCLPLSDHEKVELGQGSILIVAQLEHVITRILRRKRVMRTARRHCDFFRFRRTFAQD